MPGWFGVEATAGEELNWAARREAAKRVRASDGDERAAKKQTRIDNGSYANPDIRCGGNAPIYASHSDVHHPSYRRDGKPPGSGPYRPAEAFPNLPAWHSQNGVPGAFPQQQLEKRLERAVGGRPLEVEVPQHAFHLPALRELDSDGKPIGTNSSTTGWCDCSRGLVVRFYPIGCLLPLCCRANAVPNNGWLDATARDGRVYYCSD